jgi:spermidine/putrescine-binding protein
MKRKIISLCTLLTSALLLSGCKGNSSRGDLKVFQPGEYIDESLIKEFEEEYNCSVTYLTFDSNEAAVTKMSTEDYDIVTPSDYSIEQLAKQDMLLEIDWSRIEATQDNYTEFLRETLADLKSDKGDVKGFDLLKYGVPYFYGQVVIVYDANKISKEDVETEGWDIFRNPKYKNLTAYYDNPRDGFMAAEKALGYSMNTTDPKELEEAFNWVIDVRKATNSAFKTDELLSEMPQGKYALSLMYSGDAIYAMSEEDENVDLQMFAPESGTNVYIDAMVIPKNCKNVDLAYNWINFMNRHENALANSIEVGYTSPFTSVCEEITREDSENGEYADYADYYNLEYNPKNEVYRFDSQLKIKINDFWVKLKLY